VETSDDARGIDSKAGWFVAAAAFLSLFAVFGVAYSFGAVFTAIRDEFGVSKSETAWLFAITTFLYFVFGIVTGRLSDRYGPRPVLLAGAAAMAGGLITTAAVDELWVGYITYGFGVGVGVACAYVPMVAAVGGWFEHHRTTALGVAVAGIGVGTLVAAPAAKALTNAHDWRTTYVVLGIASAALLSLASVFARRPPVSTAGASLPPLRDLLSSSSFRLLYLGMLLSSMALFLPFVFLDDYLSARGSDQGPLLIGVIGAASVVGRLGIGALADRVGLATLYLGSCAAIPLTFLLWLAADTNFVVLLVFATSMGVSYGGFIALAPAVTAMAFGPEGLGGVLGALYTSAGIGGLIGPPLAGALEGRFGYTPTILLAIALGLAAVPALWPVAQPAKRNPADPEVFTVIGTG